jgi:hypothetical protein
MISTIIAILILVVIFIVFVYVAIITDRTDTDTFAQKIKFIFHEKIMGFFAGVLVPILSAVKFTEILEHFNLDSSVTFIYGMLFYGLVIYSLFWASKQ